MRRILIFTRRFVVATFSGILITAGAMALFWVLMGGWVATRISSLANQHVFQDRMTRLTVGRVTGSVFSNIIFEDVHLERQIGGEWRSAVFAKQVEARYDVWALTRGRSELREIKVWQPLIEIAEDSTGRWVLPVGNIPGEKNVARKELLFSKIEIVNGRLRLIGRKRGWEAFNMEAQGKLAVLGDKVDLDLEKSSFEMLEPVGQVKELSGELHLDARKIRGKDLRLFWGGSSLIGNFAWDPADSLKGLDVQASLLRIPLGRLRGFLDAAAIPDSGYVSGTARLSGGARRFDFEAALSGRYDKRQVDTLSVAGARDGSLFRFDRLELRMPECGVNSGEGWVDLARGGSLHASLDIAHVQVDSIPLKAVKWIPGVGRGRLDLSIQRFLKGAAGPLAAQVDVDLQGEKAFGVPLIAARGHVDHQVGRDARITDVVLTLPDGGLIEGGGVVRPGDVLDFNFTAETGDWSQLKTVVAIPGISGSGRAAGKLIGTSREPVIDLSGNFAHARGWEMAADSVNLVHLVGPFAPRPKFVGTVEAQSLQSLGRVIDHVEMDFNWIEPRLTFPRLKAVDNDTLALTHGWTDFDKSGTSMNTVLDGGTLTIGNLTWTPQENIQIEGRGQYWYVLPARYRSGAGDAVVEAEFDTDRQTMDARFTDMNLDLVVMAGAQKPPEFHAGTMKGDLRLNGPIMEPDPSGHLLFLDYRWDKAVVDSSYFDFGVVGRRLDQVHGWASAGDGRLTFAGAADLPKSGWNMWTDWRDRKPIAWENVVLDRVEVKSDGVPIERWAAWNPQINDLTGRARGHAILSGALGAPQFSVDMVATGAARGAYRLDSLSVSASYAPDRLQIDRMRVVHEDALSIVSGTVPVRLSLAPRPGMKLLDQPMDLDLNLPRGDLAVVQLFAPMVETAAGNLTGHVRLRGTPKRYLAYGDLELNNGKLQLKDREEVVENLKAQVRFDSTTVRLISLTGNQATGATLSGHGTFELGVAPDRAYKLELDLRKFVLRQSANYAARFDGHFEIVPLRLVDGNIRPMMVGDVRLDRAEVIQEFDQPQPVPEPNQIFYYSVSIDAPRGIFIVNNDVDMELRGRITARRTPDRSELIGDLEILHGYYTLLLRRFRILSGTLNFNRVDTIDPEIDISAETNDGNFIIGVHLSGQASNPVIEFAARNPKNPGETLTNDEILRRLTPGGDLAAFKNSSVDEKANQRDREDASNRRVRDALGSVQLLLGQLQRDLARRIGVDEIRLDTPGPSDTDEQARKSSYGKVGVSKWITPDVSVSYSQGLSGTQARDLSVEYRLGRLLFLRGEIINRNRTASNDEDPTEYNLDLRFWHEY